MDPITLIGLLASVSNLVSASQSAVKLMRSFKDGDKEISELIAKVALFEENLRGFERVFRSQVVPRPSVDALTNAITDSSARLGDLERRLLQICQAENLTVRRMRWIQNKAAFKDISKTIGGTCALLHSLVSVAQMYVKILCFWTGCVC